MSEADGLGPEWRRLLEVERRLQSIVEGTILVGGAAAAIHAGHRLSVDGDHVLPDLRERFDQVVASLEAEPGWRTSRLRRPVLVLGEPSGVRTGIRQLRRSRPLETEIREGIRLPTLGEMARVKAWLLIERDTTRDYVDTVVLLERLGSDQLTRAFRDFDAIYERGPGGEPPLTELVSDLAEGRPADRESVDLGSYKGLRPPWTDWSYVLERGRHWAGLLARLELTP